MYDVYLGGKDNFEVDRVAAQQVLDSSPWVGPTARANRRFTARATRYCLGVGIRQVLDVGPGLPTEPSVLSVTSAIDPQLPVVVVDNDPEVLAHYRTRIDQGRRVVEGDIRNLGSLWPRLDPVLDWRQPVAVVMTALLHFLTDEDGPAEVVAAFRERMAPGSCLVLSHACSDGTDQQVVDRIQAAYDQGGRAPLVFRTAEEIAGLCAGCAVVEPGVVDVARWRPGLADAGDGGPVDGSDGWRGGKRPAAQEAGTRLQVAGVVAIVPG